MELEALQQKLIDFFVEMQDYHQFFKRKLYADAFAECWEKNIELVAALSEACEQAEDEEQAVEALAGAIPDYAHSQLGSVKSKNKREGLMIDYNMAMVTFVIPVLGYDKNEYCSRIIDRMVERWNEPPVTMKISRSDFESLKDGFKSHPCYITTAVCASRDQGDDCYELNLLRDYRDHYLTSSKEGERIVEEYYNVAPTIVNRINRQADAARIYDDIYSSYLRRCIELIQADRLEECRRVYASMVEDLEKKYLFS